MFIYVGTINSSKCAPSNLIMALEKVFQFFKF